MNDAGYRNKRPGVNQIQSYFYNACFSVVSGESSGRAAICSSSISPSISLVSKSRTETAENLWA